MTDWPNPLSDTLVEAIYQRGGGMINCGDHLGVFAARPEHIGQCPLGWVFVDMSTASLEDLQQAVQAAHEGRKNWPHKADPY